MPEELTTFSRVLREEPFSFLFEDVALGCGDAIPELGLALMEIVNCGQVKILLVPAKQSFPGSNVAIWSIDAFHFGLH